MFCSYCSETENADGLNLFLNLIVLSLKIYVVDQDNIFSERRIPVKSVVVFFMHQDRRSSRCISQFLSSR